MKRVLTIQDISCLGKCSLTIALPVISALGVETVILPTAVLSTHTMFKNFTCKDLSDQIEPIASHTKRKRLERCTSDCSGLYCPYDRCYNKKNPKSRGMELISRPQFRN